MKLYHKNPRQITEKQFTDLGGSLSRLGDLGGIVHDLNSDEIIGGNQRSRVFDINQCDIQLDEQYLEPDEQGTVGRGYIIWKGHKYSYRQVRWNAKQCEEANIRANKNGGDFDKDGLANDFELDDLLDWGFEKFELGIFEDLPDLEDLKEKYGEPGERDFWPIVRVQVSPETFEKYKALMETLPGADEAEKFDALVSGGN